MNTMKTFLLMAVLTALLMVVGNMIGGQGGIVIAVVFALVMNVGTYWFSDTIVLRMYGARPLQENDAPALFSMTREMTGRGGIPMPRLYRVPSDQPNAFATGRDPAHAAVVVTDGMLRMLSRDELRGVIGHELAHIKHHDILIGTVAATFAGAISMLATMAQWAMIFGGGRSSGNTSRGEGLIAILVAPLAAMLIQMAVSRSREYAADQGGAAMAGNPLSLAGALRKLDERSHAIPMHASPATAHMFIVNPLRGGGLANLFSTHPPIGERIRRLEAMAYGSAVVAR